MVDGCDKPGRAVLHARPLVRWPTVEDTGPMARVLLPDGSYAEWSPHDWQQVMQDALDGAALRRLREALPEGVGYMLSWRACFVPKGRHAIDLLADRDHLDYEDIAGTGDTIAEAADKCREALG